MSNTAIIQQVDDDIDLKRRKYDEMIKKERERLGFFFYDEVEDEC